MSEQWYYSVNNQKFGPVGADQLVGLASSGKIGPNDLVWKQGLENWVPASQVNGLRFNSGPQPNPNPTQPPMGSARPSQFEQIPQFAQQSVAAGMRQLHQSFGAAFTSTAENAIEACAVLASSPVALTYYTLLWGMVSAFSMLGIVTLILFPMFAMGYLNILRQHVAREKVKLSAFISFMRHGPGALWHLFMLFAAFIVTMSMLIGPVAVLGALLSGFLGSGMYLGGPTALNSSTAMLSMILMGILALTYLFAVVSAMILFFFLLLEVSIKEPEPEKPYHLVFNAFSQTLHVGQKYWKEILLSGFFIACVAAVFGVVLALIPQIFSENVVMLLTAILIPLAFFALIVYITVFVSMTCINLQKKVPKNEPA